MYFDRPSSPPRPGLTGPRSAARSILKRAFGWSGKAYWRNEKKTPEIPTPDTILAVTDYLTSLGLSDDEVRGVIDSFPEVLGCSVEKRLKANVAQLERDWKMTAPGEKIWRGTGR